MTTNYAYAAGFNETDDTPSSYSSSAYEEDAPKPISWKIAVGLVLGVISLVTVLGNALVIAAFATDWKLRGNRGNWFILNLSVSDFFIGLMVIPVNSLWVVNGSWPLGEYFCKVWIVIDYTASYMSVLTMVMISLDRYWLVTKKLAYRDFVTRTKVLLMVGTAWLLCVVFYVVVTFAWTLLTGEQNIDYSDDCEMESVYNLPFNIALILLEFVIPLFVIICLNWRIYSIIKLRSTQFIGSKPTASAAPSRGKNTVAPMPTTASNSAKPPPTTTAAPDSPGRDKKEFQKHHRAAFTLAILIGIFIICWLPYYTTVILGTFCDECVPDSVWEFTNYLLWCNSTLNPFLYAVLHARYRDNFIRLLGLKRFYQRWAASRLNDLNDTESTNT